MKKKNEPRHCSLVGKGRDFLSLPFAFADALSNLLIPPKSAAELTRAQLSWTGLELHPFPMRSCAVGPGRRPESPTSTSLSSKSTERRCHAAVSPPFRLQSRQAPSRGLSSFVSRQKLRYVMIYASAAAMDAPQPSSSRAASNANAGSSFPTTAAATTTTTARPPSLAARPRQQQQQPLPPPPSTTSYPQTPAIPLRRNIKKKSLDAWLDSIVSACDDAVGSRLSGALFQADAAAVGVQRKKAEARASERNYERYQRRFLQSGGSVSGIKNSSGSGSGSPASSYFSRRRRREEEQEGGYSEE